MVADIILVEKTDHLGATALIDGVAFDGTHLLAYSGTEALLKAVEALLRLIPIDADHLLPVAGFGKGIEFSIQ